MRRLTSGILNVTILRPAISLCEKRTQRDYGGGDCHLSLGNVCGQHREVSIRTIDSFAFMNILTYKVAVVVRIPLKK